MNGSGMNPDNIRIVLVETTHPGNIGSAARAMKTMGLDRLHLVSPHCFPDAQAVATAGHAEDVLEQAVVHDTLEDALAGAGLVLGLTARRRRVSATALDARAAGADAAAASQRHPVALVFGREHSGLTNDEVARCHRVVHIPANPDYSSLNLAAAVQVLTYELRMAGGTEPAGEAAPAPASAEHLEGFYEHLFRVVKLSGYATEDSMDHLKRRLRRLFNRAQPETTELNILRGLLAAIERRVDGDG
ncbi:MAG: RNA methyltransferase [Ectothiorhodospiraceae bacterium]|jgi:TrmH family RNA methyltransferase